MIDNSPQMPESNNRGDDVESLLHEGETVILSAQIHWGIYWKAIMVMAFSFYLMIMLFNLGLFLFFVSAVMFAQAYLTKYFLRLILTDKQVIIRSGIINLDTVRIHINKVESVEVTRTIMARLLGYATVLITGTGSRITIVPFVDQAEAFRRALDKAIFDREEAK